MNFLKRLFTKRSNSPIKAIVKPAHQISLVEWRSTPSLVLEAKELMRHPTFQALLVVMKEESPVNYFPNTEGVNPTADLQSLGKIRGYHLALNNLLAFSTPLEAQIELEPTFQPDNAETEQKL